MSFIVTPVEQVLGHDTPSESTPIDDAHLDAAFDALVAQKPIDDIYNALYDACPSAADLYLRCPIDDIRLDAASHALGAEAPLADVFAILFNITLTDPPPEDPEDPEASEFTVPYIPAPSPYGMGLSFESSGWRAPVWRSPESREFDSMGIDPRLILPNPPESPPRRAASASSDDDMVVDLAISFETPEAIPVDSDSDEDDSDDSDNDSDDPQDDTDSDFEERPKRSRAPRATRPLPCRVAPKPAVPSPRARTSRASAPVSQRSTSSSSASPSSACSSSASSSASTASGKKRKATRTSGRRASKKVAVATSFRLPHIAGVTDPDLPAPANSTGVCATYWPLLRLGCTVVGDHVRCNIDGCKKETNCWGDMGRHVPALHYRDQIPQLGCDACPCTFSREDAQKRHLKRFIESVEDPDHFSDSRKAFLIVFNTLPEVVDMRNNCAGDSDSYKKLNKELKKLFHELRPKAPEAPKA
ncbi:hypothetical protein B0H12DRAFT_1232922 [Mycena haematopus]|nr:hypothetical protein B0H12DRAFT_1232922 [Mycena haematopus]